MKKRANIKQMSCTVTLRYVKANSELNIATIAVIRLKKYHSDNLA